MPSSSAALFRRQNRAGAHGEQVITGDGLAFLIEDLHIPPHLAIFRLPGGCFCLTVRRTRMASPGETGFRKRRLSSP